MFTCIRMKKKKEESFIQNGSMLVEAMVSICNRKCNPIRSFTVKELQRISNNCRTFYAFPSRFYEGFLQGKPIFVKYIDEDAAVHQSIINSIVIASRMSVHKNVLKLIGCCLEFETPSLVHEFAVNGTLESCLFDSNGTNRQPLSWKCRLRIAMDMANVVAYLHNAFSRPIIHRDIRPTVILLDESNVAKLSDFSLCIHIPEGKSHVEDARCGRKGCIAPEYFISGFATEKVDVFDFGLLLANLLTGKKRWYPVNDEVINLHDSEDPYFEVIKVNGSVDPSILQEGCWPAKERQLQDF